MLGVIYDMSLGFNILLGLSVKSFLAAIRAEKVRLSFVLRLASSGLGINLHTTNGVFRQESHLLS